MQPDFSPWGEIDWCETLIPGMEMVATPSHDGIMVSREASIFPLPQENAAFGQAGIFALKRMRLKTLSCGNCWIKSCGRFPNGFKTLRPLRRILTGISRPAARTIGAPEPPGFKKRPNSPSAPLPPQGGKPMRQIAKSILLRLTAEEYAHLKATADAAGLKLEPMLRQLILGVELRPRPPDEYTALLRELSAIGNNVNQIAYWANARKYVSNAEIQEAAALVREAFALVKEAL